MRKRKSKVNNLWIRDLENYMETHPPTEDGKFWADLPDSVKKAHEQYSSKANHSFPGIEVGSAIVTFYGKKNGITAPSEERLIEVSKVITIWLGVRSVAELAQMDIRPPTPGDRIEDYLSKWLAEEKAS